MAQYVANGSRHLRARCTEARRDGAKPVRVDDRPGWLAAARALLPRCGSCWRQYEARQPAWKREQEVADLARARRTATDEDRRVVEEIEALTRARPKPASARVAPVPPVAAPERFDEPATPTASGDASEVLLRIGRCPEIPAIIDGAPSPCAEIVSDQGADLRGFQLPEPWSGDIENAPLLFVSSNPSISGAGEGSDGIDHGHSHPRWRWPDADLVEFFTRRFGGGQREWIRNGVNIVGPDSSVGRPVAFWAGVKKRAEELYERPVRPGDDYALTEVVRCKSRQEKGVRAAAPRCVARHLRATLETSGATVIVVLGSIARDVMSAELGVPGSGVHGPVTVAGRERLVAFLPHPNAHSARTFADRVAPTDLARLRAALRPTPRATAGP